MDFTFIHAADIHLDSPLRGLKRYEGAPIERIRSATREAFKNLVELAIEENINFIVISGDIYDGDWKDFNTGLFFSSQMSKLKKAGIPVFFISGNHDAASIITKEIKLPDNVRQLSPYKAETIILDELQVAIHGQGFKTKAVTDNIVKNYPKQIEGYFNIGVLHTSLTGREGHENYAPCSLDELKDKRYQYWALGHIHQRELLHDSNPVILFPGNIQGRHINETGNKGCTVVHVKNEDIDFIEHRSLDVLRWENCIISVDEVETIDQLFEKVKSTMEELFEKHAGRLLAVRIEIIGTSPIHFQLINDRDFLINNIRSIALEVGAGDIWVEKVKPLTNSITNMSEAVGENSPITTVLKYFETIVEDDEVLDEISAELDVLKRALPHELQLEYSENYSREFLKVRKDNVKDTVLHYFSQAKEDVNEN